MKFQTLVNSTGFWERAFVIKLQNVRKLLLVVADVHSSHENLQNIDDRLTSMSNVSLSATGKAVCPPASTSFK